MKIIKQLREKSNFTQAELAANLGISRQMYIKYENSEVEPPISIIKKLAKLYKVSYEILLNEESELSKFKYSFKEEKTLQVADSVPNSLYSYYFVKAYENACRLQYDELIKLLMGVVNLMEQNKKSNLQKMSQEENMAGFEKFTGKINVNYNNVSYKDLLCAELDKRYGINEV